MMNEKKIHKWLQKNIKDWTSENIWQNDLLDDIALIKTNQNLIGLTTDSIIENNHFTFKYCKAQDIAYKLFYKNYSDLIIKNIRPQFCLLNLNLSTSFVKGKNVLLFLKTLKKLLKKHKIVLCGGDIAWSQTSIFTMTMGGEKSEQYISRKNNKIKKGDLVVLTGIVGKSQVELKKILSKKKVPNLVVEEGYRRPKPYLKLLDLYKRVKVLTSIDLSDSLHQSLLILASLNNLKFNIDLNKIPFDKKLFKSKKVRTKKETLDSFSSALNSAEDLNALFIVPQDQKRNLKNFDCKVIGIVVKKDEKVRISYLKNNKKIPQQFNKEILKKQFLHF